MLRVTNDDVDQDRQQAGVLHTWFMGGDIMTAAMRLEGKYYEMIMLCQYQGADLPRRRPQRGRLPTRQTPVQCAYQIHH